MKLSVRIAAFSVAALLISCTAYAQLTAAEYKAVDKSKTLYQNGKYDKAISTITKVIDQHPFNEDLWKLDIIYQNDRYTAEFNKVVQSLVKQINAGKTNVKLNSEKLDAYQNSMLVDCLRATLYCKEQEDASQLLYQFLLMPSVDTAISDDAKEAYKDGDKDYSDQNYTSAIRKYKKAVGLDSNYFNATYSIGISYYKDGDYENAAPWFRKAIRIAPKRTVSYKSLADTYMQMKKYEDARNACIDGILIYPDVSFFSRLDKIAEKMGKTFNRHWQARGIFPNDVTVNQGPVTGSPWQYYREAKEKMADNCNDDGFIKHESSLTKEKYLESYSYEYMLQHSKTGDESDYQEMAFARKMQDAGYLDCYAFVSMYHFNFNKQYVDFSKNNADRIRTYILTYLFE